MTRKKAVETYYAAEATGSVTFNVWFAAQFGARPSPRPEWNLRDEADALSDRASRVRQLADSVAAWEDKRHAALCAWNERVPK